MPEKPPKIFPTPLPGRSSVPRRADGDGPDSAPRATVRAASGRRLRILVFTLLLLPPAAADTIILRNGNRLEGSILSEGKKTVRIELPYGTMDIPCRRILEIKRTSPLETLFFHGEQLLHYEDFALALEQFEKACRLAPESVKAREKLAGARLKYALFLKKVRRYDDALSVLRKAETEETTFRRRIRSEMEEIAAIKEAYRPKFLRARSTLLAGRIEEAREDLARLWETYPGKRKEVGRPLAYAEVKLGDKAARDKRFAEAARHYELALTFYPDWFPKIIRRYVYSQAQVAQALAAERNLGKAEEVLTHALAFSPENEILHYLLGRVLEEQGRLQEAIAHFDRISSARGRPFDPRAAEARERELAFREARERAEKRKATTEGPLRTVKSKRFRVHCADRDLGRRVLEALELHFRSLAPRFNVKKFERPCDVYLYSTREKLAESSHCEPWAPACATWEYKMGHLLHQEISTTQDCPQLLASVLRHELTHILVGARYGYRRAVPLWANEGLAVYHEPDFKKVYYRRALELAAKQKRLIRLEKLIAARDYPGPEELDLFYGQSLSLVTFLIKKRGFELFLAFLEAVQKNPGDWRVWKRYYRFNSPEHLENSWRRNLSGR